MNHVGKIVSLIVYAVMAGLEFGSWRHDFHAGAWIMFD